MEHKSFFQRLDFIILGVVIILAAALSGTSLRFSLSKIDLAGQTSSLLPYVAKNSQQTLQFNSVNFKSTQPTPSAVLFECPNKTAPPDAPVAPAPTCPQQQCGICKNDGTCVTMTLTVCSGTCPDCSQRKCVPITPLSPPPPPAIKTPVPVVK